MSKTAEPSSDGLAEASAVDLKAGHRERVRERFRGQLRFVFRHVPRSARDGFAKQAAEAAEAAAAQGKFWPMHRELFLHPGEHDVERLVTHARHIGLDVPRFLRELESRVYAPRVKELSVRALRHGVVGVPTLFVAGERFLAPPKADPFQTRPVTSWNGRVVISCPLPATPMMVETPHPLWQHSSAWRISLTLPTHSKV